LLPSVSFCYSSRRYYVHQPGVGRQLLQQDYVIVHRAEQEDRLSGIDEQVERIKNDIESLVTESWRLRAAIPVKTRKDIQMLAWRGRKLELPKCNGGSEDSSDSEGYVIAYYALAL
jgi:hypothetical protein